MDVDRFEEFARERSAKPVARFTHRNAEIYVAEGYSNGDLEHEQPHYKLFWMVARDKPDIAQPLYVNFGEGTTQNQRIDDAKKCAERFIEANVGTGRYE